MRDKSIPDPGLRSTTSILLRASVSQSVTRAFRHGGLNSGWTGVGGPSAAQTGRVRTERNCLDPRPRNRAWLWIELCLQAPLQVSEQSLEVTAVTELPRGPSCAWRSQRKWAPGTEGKPLVTMQGYWARPQSETFPRQGLVLSLAMAPLRAARPVPSGSLRWAPTSAPLSWHVFEPSFRICERKTMDPSSQRLS